MRILGAIEEYVYTGEFLVDGTYRVVFAGPCRERFLGLSADDSTSAVWAHYVHPDDIDVFEASHDRALASSHLDVQYRMVGGDGVVRWVRDRGRIRRDHGRCFLDGAILDVTAIRITERQLEAARAEADRLAHVDPLTGLANRRSLPERLSRLARLPALGVLAVDVDHFKGVNDLFGHACGDAVLSEIALRLRASTRTEDEIVRMGGEEFLVLLPGVGDDTALLDAAEAIRRAVGGPPVLAEAERIPVTVSIGAAATTEQDPDATVALNGADAALYAAKRAGRNRVHLDGTHPAPGDEPDEEPSTIRLASTLAAVSGASDACSEADATAVSLLAARIARRSGASGARVLRCRLAGLVLDLGYLRLPPDLMTTAGEMSAQDWTFVRRHTAYSQQLVEAVPELRSLSLIVRHHHERWDGAGYPDGLSGTAIPVEARILAAADSWHAMTSDRPHRVALDAQAAEVELERSSGSHLDPDVVRALRSVLTHRREHEDRGPMAVAVAP